MEIKTINIKQLTNKYCDINYIYNIKCFMQNCNKKATYVKILNYGFPEKEKKFHCNIHKTDKHLKITFKN